MRRFAIASLLALFQIFPAGATSSETRSYVGGIAEIAAYAYCDGELPAGLPAPTGQGFVCFNLSSAPTSVDITIADAIVPLYVPALYVFYGPNDALLDSGGFCDAVIGAGIPAGAVKLYVFLPESPLGIYPSCPLFGTTGTITATFSP